MTSRSKKTQPTRKNPVIKELKQEIFDLKKLAHENNYVLLQSKVDKLERENKRLRYNNSKRKQESSDDDSDSEDDDSDSEEDDDDSDSEDDDNDTIRPSKQQNKPSDEERAKVLLKTLLKTFPELEIKEDETFRSEANVEICRKLIPKLLKEMKAYSPTYEQVDSWLQSIHRSKRNAYLKSNQSNQFSFSGFSGFSARPFYGFAGSERSHSSAPKQETKRKRKANVIFEEEVEEGAKDIMKALLKTYPHEFTLRIEDTFRSQVNINICEKLIPKLQDDVSPAYNLSHEQVESWLQTFHRNKRNAYLRSDFITYDH